MLDTVERQKKLNARDIGKVVVEVTGNQLKLQNPKYLPALRRQRVSITCETCVAV